MRSLIARSPIVVIALMTALSLAGCARAQDQLAAGRAFMTQNAMAPDVKTLPSGLQYKIVKSGPATGPHPKAGDLVRVNYEGKTIDGKVFDSSFARGEPADFPLAGLIQGWLQALPLMTPGDEWMLYIPPELAYGSSPKPGIPANSTLIFRIQFLDMLADPPPQFRG